MKIVPTSLLALAVATSSALAWAQAVIPPSGGEYVLRRHVIAAGGARASGAAYVLTGTLAQSIASSRAAPSIGASYRATSGFHVASTPSGAAIFRSGFEN